MVLFSLVFQGLSIKPLLSILGINKKEEGFKEYEKLIAKGFGFETAISEVHKVRRNLFLSETAAKDVTSQYEQELVVIHSKLEKLFEKYPNLKAKQKSILQKHALYAQHEAIEKLNKANIISDEIAEHEYNQIIDKIVKLDGYINN
ncbi:hypothetical protein QFZ28_002500 [Neobacillus niacini]|nr:hypothetical protein [Neobacillus niacini]